MVEIVEKKLELFLSGEGILAVQVGVGDDYIFPPPSGSSTFLFAAFRKTNNLKYVEIFILNRP